MCFIRSNFNEEKSIRIATEDITCYKILKRKISFKLFNKNRIKSLYQDYAYKLKKTYKLPNLIMENDIVHIGFHSFINKTPGAKYLKTASEHLSLCPRNITYIHCECIIPKGSEYYINSAYGECVSNQIIISKIL